MHDVCIFVLIVILYLPRRVDPRNLVRRRVGLGHRQAQVSSTTVGWVNGEFPMDF